MAESIMSSDQSTAGATSIFAETVESSPIIDFPAHFRTYRGFTTALRWVVAHLALILLGLYFIAVGGNPTLGGFFLLCAIALGFYGVYRSQTLREDLEQGLSAGPTAQDSRVVEADEGR